MKTISNKKDEVFLVQGDTLSFKLGKKKVELNVKDIFSVELKGKSFYGVTVGYDIQ